MNILRRIPITIAAISAMVTVGSCQTPATDWNTLEATPHQLVLLFHWGGKSVTVEEIREAKRLGAEHCKKFDKFAGKSNLSLNLGSPSSVFTNPCVDENDPKKRRRTYSRQESQDAYATRQAR